MEVRFFGEFEAIEAGVPVPVRGTKQGTVLALLALDQGRPVSADRLIDVLWGDAPVANPVNALQAQIGQLRRTFGATAIVTSEAGYALCLGPDDVDAARFEQLVAQGRGLFEGGEMALASSALGEALRLRRGEPLSEFGYAGFADAERAHLDELALVAIETRAQADLALGRHGGSASALRCGAGPADRPVWVRPRPCGRLLCSLVEYGCLHGLGTGSGGRRPRWWAGRCSHWCPPNVVGLVCNQSGQADCLAATVRAFRCLVVAQAGTQFPEPSCNGLVVGALARSFGLAVHEVAARHPRKVGGGRQVDRRGGAIDW